LGGRASAHPRRPLPARAPRERAQALLAQTPRRPVGRRLRSRQPPLRDGAVFAGDRPERPRAATGRGRPGRGAFSLLGSRGVWLAGDVAERELAPRRLGERRPVALLAPDRGEG